jgi:hypothetical protein
MKQILLNGLGFLLIMAASPNWASAMGVVDGGGLSKTYLICDNNQHPSVSYRVDILTGFFDVNGTKTWTTGADVYRIVHFSNQESLVMSGPVTANGSYTEIQGEGFSLVQSGPGNVNTQSFPATLKLTEASGAELTVNDLQCEVQ